MKRKIGFVLSAAFAIVLALLILPKGEARRSAANEAGGQTPNSVPVPDQAYRSPGERHSIAPSLPVDDIVI